MDGNIRLVEKNCTGCGSCADVCPSKCIDMKLDAEGFYYPYVDNKKCLRCGKCLQVCSHFCAETNDIICGYAAINKNKEMTKKSSSGGMFPLLASYWIKKGGYVCAAKMLENHEVEHLLTNKIEDIPAFQGSKYVQSISFRCLKRMREILELGNRVLYIGTPCQVQGVKLLFAEYSDLIFTVDLICHGISSPEFFKEHIKRKYDTFGNKIKNIRFREKTVSEMNAYRLILESDKKSIKIYENEDAYYASYLSGKSFRESCYNCKFADKKRCGDITIGDCATASKYKKFDYGEVLSTVLVNTEKGRKVWQSIAEAVICEELDIDDEVKLNYQLHESYPRAKERDEIYKDFKEMTLKAFEKKYTYKMNGKLVLKRILKRLIPVNVRWIIIKGINKR